MSTSFSQLRSSSSARSRLISYEPLIQQYGTFFSAFPWQAYFTGTYRTRQTLLAAEDTLRRFLRVLEHKLRVRIAYIAVAERTTSGLGKPPGPWHWHALLSGPPRKSEDLLKFAPLFWRKFYGDVHVQPYDINRNAGRYLAKTAAQLDFGYLSGNLHLLGMPSQMDLFVEQQHDPYVPDHVRHKLTGQTLRLSAPGTLS